MVEYDLDLMEKNLDIWEIEKLCPKEHIALLTQIIPSFPPRNEDVSLVELIVELEQEAGFKEFSAENHIVNYITILKILIKYGVVSA